MSTVTALPRTCACGCGERPKAGRNYRLGHKPTTLHGRIMAKDDNEYTPVAGPVGVALPQPTQPPNETKQADHLHSAAEIETLDDGPTIERGRE